MPGFDNDCCYFGAGIDTRGVTPIVNQMTTGTLLIGSSVAPYRIASTLTAGAGIGIANANGSITISSLTGAFKWNEVTSALNPVSLVKENGYIPKGAGVVTFVLPASAAQGDTFMIAGYGNLWTLTQNALQSVTLGPRVSTIGITGSVTATSVKDTITLLCVTANTEFQIIDCTGNLTFV